MQKGSQLTFPCLACQNQVAFSLWELHKEDEEVTCPHCNAIYAFKDDSLRRQLQKFDALCRQLVESEEILADTSVGVTLNGQEVLIPYRILLTRFTSVLQLRMGEITLPITFRLEPTQDYPKGGLEEQGQL